MKYTDVDVAVDQGIRVAHAISVGVYLLSSIAVVSVVGAVVFQLAFSGAQAASSKPDSTNSATLVWTAPGDDGNVGTAASYIGKYAVNGLSAANWDSATSFTMPTPQPAGTTQTMTVTGLSRGTLYAFAVKAKDDAGNEAAISNIATKKTDLVACTPDWSCTAWSVCRDNSQIRSCIDVATPACGNDFERPIEQQSCTLPQPADSCTPRWSCTAWSACSADVQTRSCLDLSRCGTDVKKPAEDQPCGAGGSQPNPSYLLTVPAKGGEPQVKAFNAFTGKRVSSFFPFLRSSRAGVEVAGGDVIPGGTLEIVAGSGLKTAPEVRVFSLNGKRQTSFFAYPKAQKSGVEVAVGDVDGDGRPDIVTVPAAGYPGIVRVFQYDKGTKRFKRSFEVGVLGGRFRGGVNLAVGDLDRNGLAEIVAAPAVKGKGSLVEVYEFDLSRRRLARQAAFSAYPRNFRSGIRLAVGDFLGDGNGEIVVSPSPGVTDVRVFSYVNHAPKQLTRFYAASTSFRGGADVAALDVDSSGSDEILTVSYSNGSPGVRAFARNYTTGKFSRTTSPFPPFVYNASFTKGVRLGTAE